MEALPKCVYFKHGSYYLVKQGKWHFLTKDVDQISNQLQLRFGFADGKVPPRVEGANGAISPGDSPAFRSW